MYVRMYVGTFHSCMARTSGNVCSVAADYCLHLTAHYCANHPYIDSTTALSDTL